MYLANPFNISNNPRDQNRKPTPNQLQQPNAYSASPSQLTLGGDLQSNTQLPQNPYHQQYSYLPGPHDPTGTFAFPHNAYRPHPLDTHQQPPQQQQQQQQQYQQTSPTNTRKRRISDLDALPGSSSSNASAFTNPTGLMGAPEHLDTSGLGGPSQQTLPSPTVKKGRTNTPWTPAEEQRLKALRDAGSSWSEIAKTFPTRTEGSVKKHWYKVCIVHPRAGRGEDERSDDDPEANSHLF